MSGKSVMVTIALADDHAIVRQGLRSLLESDPQFKVVGEAADGHEAIELVKRRKPMVLIADLMMPGLNGLEITQKVFRLKLNTRVIVLSMHRDEAYVLEALRNGAAGYVTKESSGAELFQAIRATVAGRRYLSPTIYEVCIDSHFSKGTILQKAQNGSPDPYDELTARERKILQLVVEGATNRDIGSRLKIGSRTVKTHRAALMRKFGLNSRRKLIRYALQRGIVPQHQPKSITKKYNKSGTPR
jgi:two-component system response regulator NreC